MLSKREIAAKITATVEESAKSGPPGTASVRMQAASIAGVVNVFFEAIGELERRLANIESAMPSPARNNDHQTQASQ